MAVKGFALRRAYQRRLRLKAHKAHLLPSHQCYSQSRGFENKQRIDKEKDPRVCRVSHLNLTLVSNLTFM